MKQVVLNYLLTAYRRRRFWSRVLISLTVGLFFLGNEETSSFDTRLQLRGHQIKSSKIVLLTISPSDMNSVLINSNHRIKNIAEVSDITDSFYWNEVIWKQIIHRILRDAPQKVGINFYFNEGISPEFQDSNFLDPKLIWLGAIFQDDTAIYPRFANRDKSNIGFLSFQADDDGKIRRFSPNSTSYPSMASLLTLKSDPLGEVINFRGDGNAFEKIRLAEVLNDSLVPDFFKNKIVLIGPEHQEILFSTPMGPMTRTEALAHWTDQMIEERQITRLNSGFYWVYLAVTLLFAVFIFSSFPQALGLPIVGFFLLLISSISIWLFDTFYIWLPIQSVVIQISVAWLLMVGYVASKIERRSWRFQQEQKSRQELEDLKNNFVSLISHDLNTPIAKIQAVLDRLALEKKEEIPELVTLLSSTQELHKYIQSILRVLRVESSEFKINYEVVDVNELLEEAIKSLEPLARIKDIKIFQSLEPLFSIEVDSTLMKEVFVNLIENAIKYTPKGGHITIKSHESETNVEVLIEDTGEGISEEEQQNVFGKFVRGKNQDLKTKGTGLGLYLVKYFVELHKGSISLKSSIGVGTTVLVKLPLDLNMES